MRLDPKNSIAVQHARALVADASGRGVELTGKERWRLEAMVKSLSRAIREGNAEAVRAQTLPVGELSHEATLSFGKQVLVEVRKVLADAHSRQLEEAFKPNQGCSTTGRDACGFGRLDGRMERSLNQFASMHESFSALTAGLQLPH